MKIAVSGGGTPMADGELALAFACGQQIAILSRERKHPTEIFYGACPGTPDEVIGGFLSEGGDPRSVTGLSLWSSMERHDGDNFLNTAFPRRKGIRIEYPTFGLGRNALLLNRCNVCLYLGGRLGTLTELCFGAILKRHQFVPKEAGGASGLWKDTLRAHDETALDRLHVFESAEDFLFQLRALDFSSVPVHEW